MLKTQRRHECTPKEQKENEIRNLIQDMKGEFNKGIELLKKTN